MSLVHSIGQSANVTCADCRTATDALTSSEPGNGYGGVAGNVPTSRVEDQLRSEAFYPRSWNNKEWRTGEITFDMIFGAAAESRFGAPYLFAHRGDLHAALASATPDTCIWLDRHIVIYPVKPDRSEIYFVTSQPGPEFRVESWSAKGDVVALGEAFEGFIARFSMFSVHVPMCINGRSRSARSLD